MVSDWPGGRRPSALAAFSFSRRPPSSPKMGTRHPSGAFECRTERTVHGHGNESILAADNSALAEWGHNGMVEGREAPWRHRTQVHGAWGAKWCCASLPSELTSICGASVIAAW